MNCPMCGSEIPAGVRYCPVCGGDVELASQRTQQMPGQRYQQRAAAQQPYVPQQPVVPQQPLPPQQQPVGQQHAVPMTPSVPQASSPLREIDTKRMDSTPKWPIVLIALLIVVITVLVLLIFHPWDQGLQTVQIQGDDVAGEVSPSTAPEATGGADTAAPAVDDTSAVAPAPAGLSDADAYAQLTASFDQLDGFHNQISGLASEFGGLDEAGYRDRAAALQGQIAGAQAALNALDVPAESAYAGTKAAIAELYNDLAMRIGVLVEATDASLAGGDPSAVLMRDNGEPDEHGHTNRYLIHYEHNYEAARPVAPQA